MTQTTRFVRTFLFFAFVLTTSFAWQVAQATKVVVGTCTNTYAQYPTIQAAVNAVPAGTVVYVCPGSYPEQVSITKTLTLQGYLSGTNDAAVVVPPSGGMVANATDIAGNPVAAQIFVSSPDTNNPISVTIKNITVDGTGNNIGACTPTLEGVYYQNASGSISYDTVRNQFLTDFANLGGCQNGLAINVESFVGGTAVTISNDSVRAYQKNGITATGGKAASSPTSLGPNVTISSNHVVGLAATAMNWQANPPAAENGIQVGFAASGTVSNNTVDDNIWAPDTSADSGDAASGILIYSSSSIAVSSNYVSSAQFGIVTVTSTYGPADHTTIQTNKVSGTQIFDAIDVCSASNNVQTNTIYGSKESGIHLDDTCGSGTGNSVSANIINEACAGILTGTGSNTVLTNTYYNVTNTTLSGDVCPVPSSTAKSVSASSNKARPLPYNPDKLR